MRTTEAITTSLKDQNINNAVMPKLPPELMGKEIVIIGAGLAGSATAYTLGRGGASPELFEASNRIGGRVFTDQIEGRKVERGGELINEDHRTIQGMTGRLGLTLQNLYSAGQESLNFGLLVDGKHLNQNDFVASMKELQSLMGIDIDRYGGVAEAVSAVKSITLEEYVDNSGVPEWTKNALKLMFSSEYGIPAKDISASALFVEGLQSLELQKPDLFGVGYGKYKVKEGSSALTTEMTDRIDTVNLEHKLRKVDFKDNRYTLTFDVAGQEVVRQADVVVIAVPYSALRNVDFSGCDLSLERQESIAKMRYAQSNKTFVACDSQGNDKADSVSLDLGARGFVWNPDRNSSHPSQVKTLYSHDHETAPTEADLLARLNRDHEPGHQKIIGKQSWDTELAGGSYSIDNGHLSTEGRKITEHVGGLYFVGEHTLQNASYMNSAVRSGVAAGLRILRNLFSTATTAEPE